MPPRLMQLRRRILSCLLIIQVIFVSCSDAYRLGDAIDTEIWTPKESNHEHAPKRSQMPLFGMDTTAKFGPLPDRFSISFEEGFRALPWMTLRNGYGVPLEKVEVTFIFSRSGTGEIHSMRSKTIYIKGVKAAAAADWNNQITVEYKWIEEEAVDLNGGAFVMFLAIFVVSIFFLFDLCGLCDSGEDVADPYTAPSNYGTQASAADPLAVMGGSRPTGIPKYE